VGPASLTGLGDQLKDVVGGELQRHD